METQAFLWHYMVAGGALVVLGVAAHVGRAVFNLYPDRLSDRPMLDMLISDGYDMNDRLFGTDYDDAGYYRLDSGRNLRNSVVATLIGGWAAMLVVPGFSSLVASAIDLTFAWLWKLFLFRLDQAWQ